MIATPAIQLAIPLLQGIFRYLTQGPCHPMSEFYEITTLFNSVANYFSSRSAWQQLPRGTSNMLFSTSTDYSRLGLLHSFFFLFLYLFLCRKAEILISTSRRTKDLSLHESEAIPWAIRPSSRNAFKRNPI